MPKCPVWVTRWAEEPFHKPRQEPLEKGGVDRIDGRGRVHGLTTGPALRV